VKRRPGATLDRSSRFRHHNGLCRAFRAGLLASGGRPEPAIGSWVRFSSEGRRLMTYCDAGASCMDAKAAESVLPLKRSLRRKNGVSTHRYEAAASSIAIEAHAATTAT
jgi:hypothetical protein